MNIDQKILNKIKKALQNYCKHNKGRFPQIEWIGKWMGMSYYKVVEALRILEAERFLDRNYNQYKLNPMPVDAPKQSTEIPRQSKGKRPDILLIVIRIVMGLIGIVCIGISVHFTKFWFQEFFSSFLSIMLSLSLVSFSVIAFEVAIIFWKNRQHVLVTLFGIMWGIILVFSMMSTLAAQFNKWSIKEKEENPEKIQNVHQKLIFEEYGKEEKEILLRIDEERVELKVNQNLLKQFDTLEQRKEDWRFYWSTKQAVDKSQTEMDRLEGLLKEVRNKKLEFLESNQEVVIVGEKQVFSFYIWISQMVKADPAYIRFWLFIVPAIAVDVLAAMAIGVCLFLNYWKEKEN